MFKVKDLRRSYKKLFVFTAVIKLKKIFLHLNKPSTLSFEFHSKNNFSSSKVAIRYDDSKY